MGRINSQVNRLDEVGYSSLYDRLLASLAGRLLVRIVLLVSLPIMFEPTRHVTSCGIMVRPMDCPAFRVPHVLAIELNVIACA